MSTVSSFDGEKRKPQGAVLFTGRPRPALLFTYIAMVGGARV